jgi:hypothetical protein
MNSQSKISNSKKNTLLGERKALVKDLLLIEGISRGGKFLLANILHGFDGVEHVQYYGLLEHIPFLERFGMIETKAAQTILRCEIDTHCYEMLIGRNLNLRRGDKSSIFNNPACNEFLKRCKEQDGDWALKKYSKENLCSMFILHELMPNIKIYFDTFQKLKVISIQRSPVYLVHSWYSRGLGKRYGKDPKLFSIPIQINGKNIPWFAADWGDEYLSLSEMDRVIASIEWITHASRKSYDSLDEGYKKRILFVTYEELLADTKRAIKKIESFLKRPVIKSKMRVIFDREKLPNLGYSELKNEKLITIKSKASPDYFDRLLALEAEYMEREGKL